MPNMKIDLQSLVADIGTGLSLQEIGCKHGITTGYVSKLAHRCGIGKRPAQAHRDHRSVGKFGERMPWPRDQEGFCLSSSSPIAEIMRMA